MPQNRGCGTALRLYSVVKQWFRDHASLLEQWHATVDFGVTLRRSGLRGCLRGVGLVGEIPTGPEEGDRQQVVNRTAPTNRRLDNIVVRVTETLLSAQVPSREIKGSWHLLFVGTPP